LSAWDNTAGQNKGLKSITVTTQWQRFDITTSILVAGNSTSFNIGTFASWTTGENILAWGAQVEAGSFPTSYIPTTTAPVTIRDCRGLLIEEGRTNLAPQSQNFASGSWDGDATTKTSGLGGGLDGSPTVGQFSRDSITGFSINYPRNTSVNFSSGVTYTVSAWLALGSGSPTVKFSYYNGGWITSSALALTTTLTRYTWTVTAAGTPSLGVGLEISASTPYGVKIWGFQIEAGSFATSYIPTTTGTLARGADVCNITGGNFNNFYNQSEGTLFADVSGLMNTTLSGNRAFVAISDGTYNNFFGILKAAGIAAIRGEGVTGGGANQFTLSNLYDPSTQYKVALGVKTNDTNAAFNGSLKTTDTSVTLPSTMNRLEFRDATGAVGGQPSCHLAAIRYYKKRLPNAKLAQLTA
jgi:hypothetical protein